MISPALPESPPVWQAPLEPALTSVMGRWRAGATVAKALNTERPAASPVHFVHQADLPAGEAYEAFVRRCGQVPTRDNLHDAFNGLVWLAQPALKQRLNLLQAAEIDRRGVGSQRGPVRDALTLFDENGALLQAPAVLMQALRERDWHGLFITHRACWAEARLTLFGHALFEKLATAPRKAMTAHVLLCDEPLALDAAGWARKPFAPLPVLGVPGWWPGNADPAFYDDAAVFRPRRYQAGRKPSIDR